MTASKLIAILAGTAAVSMLALVGCGGSNDSAAPPITSDGSPATIGISNGGLGKILVNSRRHTLYLFQKDSGSSSAYTGACASAWPPLRPTRKPIWRGYGY
jgi:predicted lipoprotein with Yx(FWY)xxD motif